MNDEDNLECWSIENKPELKQNYCTVCHQHYSEDTCIGCEWGEADEMGS